MHGVCFMRRQSKDACTYHDNNLGAVNAGRAQLLDGVVGPFSEHPAFRDEQHRLGRSGVVAAVEIKPHRTTAAAAGALSRGAKLCDRVENGLSALRDGKPSVRLALTPPCAPPCYDEVYDGSCLEEAEGAETATLTLALTLTPTLT